MTNRMTEGVGKLIVDALKQQSEAEIQNVVENSEPDIVSYENPENDEFDSFDESSDDFDYTPDTQVNNQNFMNSNIMKFSQNSGALDKDNFASELDDYDVPTNVAVLRQLINQLPAGVSRQTGAQIIKQTMEALGISMKGVLQEAQQVQENINNSIRDSQASIAEYKKQIGLLERQSQKLQRQYAALNEIISLFVQTNF